MPVAQLVQRTTEALGALVDAAGGLHDPVVGGPTPADHYAATYSALALCLADPDDARWQALLRAYAAQPAAALGHAPFNRLALLLLARHLQRSQDPDHAGRALIASALERCPVARRYPSNNWTLMARACDVLEAAGRGPGAAARAAARFDRCMGLWLTAAGGFIDYPERPRAAAGSTPLAYHAKALTLMLLVESLAPRAARRERLARAARWMWTWMDADGLAGGFGRSAYALFGSACTLFAGLCVVGPDGDTSVRAAWTARLAALVRQLEQQRRPDGLLGLNPHPGTGAPAGWDDYMHLTVYNAYAAGLLGWALAHDDSLPALELAPEDVAPHAVERDDQAGLLACRGARASAWLGVQGQPVQVFGRHQVELRFGALQPWRLQLDGRSAVPPPVRVPVKLLKLQPWLAGDQPLFRYGGDLYALQRMERVEVHVAGARLIALGWGRPLRAHARTFGRRSWRRGAEDADRRLCQGRGALGRGARRWSLAGHHAVRALVFDGDAGWWAQLLLLRGRPSTAALLDPHGHALIRGPDELPGVAVRCFEIEGDGWAREVSGHTLSGGPLPSALPGGWARCGAEQPWPVHDRAWLTLCGAREALDADPVPVRVQLGPDELVTPWARLSLGADA